jgi:hypothetical protein
VCSRCNSTLRSNLKGKNVFADWFMQR